MTTTTHDPEQLAMDLDDHRRRWNKAGELLKIAEDKSTLLAEARSLVRQLTTEAKQAELDYHRWMRGQFEHLPLFDRVEQEANGEEKVEAPPEPAAAYVCRYCGTTRLRQTDPCLRCASPTVGSRGVKPATGVGDVPRKAPPSDEPTPDPADSITPGLTGRAGTLWRDLTDRLSSHRAFVVAQDVAIGMQALARNSALACDTLSGFRIVELALIESLDALAAANPLPAPEKHKPRGAAEGEDLATFWGTTPQQVMAAYCADKLSAADRPKGKPPTVKPVQIGDTWYVCTGYGETRADGRGDAFLIPIMRRQSWEGSFQTPTPSHQSQPDETPETAYRGRLVRYKGEDWVMEGRQHERRVHWTVAPPAPPATPVLPEMEAPPRPAVAPPQPPPAAKKRSCEVCGACEDHRAFGPSGKRCVGCGDMAGPTTSTFMAGRPAVHCKLQWWASKAGDVVARAGRGGLGNWHDDGGGELDDNTNLVYRPSEAEIVEALGRVLGRQFVGMEVCEVEDGSGALVLELEAVQPITTNAIPHNPVVPDVAEELCLLMVCPACGREARTRESHHKQVVCVCPGYPRMRRKDSPLAGDPPEYTRPQDVPPPPVVAENLGRTVEIRPSAVTACEGVPVDPKAVSSWGPGGPPKPITPTATPHAPVPDTPPRSRNLAVVGMGEAAGRLVMLADGDFRFLAFEASFGNWGRDYLKPEDYRPTLAQIEEACSAAASSTIMNSRSERRELKLHCNDHWPDADAAVMTFDLDLKEGEHPEAWRTVDLRGLPRRYLSFLWREDLQSLGDVAAWLAEGNALVDLKGLKPRDAAELASALSDLWVKQTAEGGRGERPPWMMGGASPLGQAPEPQEKYPDTKAGVYNSRELAAKVAEEEEGYEVPQKVFSTGEAAKLCKVAPRTVSKWFDSGKLKGYKLPGSNDRRIPREQLIRFMKDNGMEMPVELQDAPAAVLPGDGTLFADAPTAHGGGL